jgi:hypothetical protein
MKKSLPEPESIADSDSAMEIARIWIADHEQHVILSEHQWSDPGAWGMMLVDLARHVAKDYARRGFSEFEVLKKIKEAFEAEWGHSTDH